MDREDYEYRPKHFWFWKLLFITTHPVARYKIGRHKCTPPITRIHYFITVSQICYRGICVPFELHFYVKCEDCGKDLFV